MNKLEGIVNSTVFNFRKTQSEILEILKARPIKYYKRIPTGNPNRPYKYFYTKNQFDKFTKVQQAVEKKKPVVQVSDLDNQIAQAQEKLRIHRDNSNPENKKLSEQQWETKLRSLQDEYRNLLKQKSIKDKSHTLTELEKLTFQRVHGVKAPDTIPVDNSGKFESQWVQTYVAEKLKEVNSEAEGDDFEKKIESEDTLSLIEKRLRTKDPKEVAARIGIFSEKDIDENIEYNQKQINDTKNNATLKTSNYGLYKQSLEENLVDLKVLKWLKTNNPFSNKSEEETLFSYADKVKDSVLEKKIEIEKKNYEDEILLKNSFPIGTKVILKPQALSNPKTILQNSSEEEVIITKSVLQDGKVYYHYEDSNSGTGFAPSEEFKSIPEKQPEKISELITKADPENRKIIEKSILGQQITEEENERNLVNDALNYNYEPKEVKVITFQLGYDTLDETIAKDYSEMPESALVFWDKKKMDLSNVATPPWFSSINETEVRRSGFRLLKFPLNTNELTGKYYVYSTSGVQIMTAKQIACVERFFQEKEKSKIGPRSRVKIYKNNTMGYTQLDIYKQKLFALGKKNRLPGSDPRYRELWSLHRKIDEVLGYVATDYELRFKDRITDGTYQKGEETSYGDSGTVNDLYDSLGVKVKMQNGSQVDKSSLKEVESGLKEVFQVFGDRSSMAKNFGLKISHSGKKMQHARKALGIYFPSFKAIGVNFIGHEESPNLTLAHEFAHFMDNYIGVREKKSFFASESGTGIESEIANVFRDGMARDFKAKAYWSRSCECFARALECYFNKKTNKPHIYRNGANPEEKYFEEKVAPLVEKFFQEKSEILKSILPSKYTNLVKRKVVELRNLTSTSPIDQNLKV
ncbi:hypothetical protein [Leptospira jelokensis]|uniref:Uncharacterized protein n=1 Tax=Leptospira jelokensis TaxID=2484931 RepID=A0A4Z1A2V6_9LEPT|nr:hypothetical protein [Leptospira jelokensis]TGL58623.1 hypothetical protein EHQ62_17155 [Leptospira jelokensis]